ncbi:MAG: GNAT family N-acetyltransferase [Emcibacteraceae bacterium]|nr:GNAT family N-acetyltransferase [Emcibacteraceae bacterium]
MLIDIKCSSLSDVENLESKWKTIEESANPDFMMKWIWISTWIDCATQHFKDDFLYNIYVLEGYENDEIISIAIFVKNKSVRRRIIKSTQLHLHNTGNSTLDSIFQEYNQILSKKGYEKKASEETIKFLLKENKSIPMWDEIIIQNTAPETLQNMLTSDLKHEILSESSDYIVDLENLRNEKSTYIESLSKQTRYHIRKSNRLYNESGEFELIFASSPEEAFSFLTEAAEMHRKRWENKNGYSQFDYEPFITFHQSLMQNAWQSHGVDIAKIVVGDKHVGTIYNFINNDTVDFYLCAFSYEENNKFKPGLSSFALLIEHYLKSGFKTFNFMNGDSPYKLKLGNADRKSVTARLYKPRFLFLIEDIAKSIKNKLR